MTKLIRRVGVPAVIALSIACSDPAGTRDRHLSRGDDYAKQKRHPDAVIEYKAAIQADPMSGVARQKLARIFVEAGDMTRATDELVRAADLLPSDLAAQIEAARALIASGRFDDAKGRADKALGLDPKNVEAQILKANGMGGLRDFDSAIQQVEGALQSDPTNAVAFANLGALRQASGDMAQAEAAFKKSVFSNPTSVAFRLALANLYWTTGRQTEAEASLVEALKLEPRHLQANRAIAMLYIGTRRAAQAEAPLKIFADSSPTSSGRLLLADYYAATRRIDDAKATYQAMAEDPTFGSAAKVRLASLGLAQGDRAGATALVEAVLSKEPQNYEALVGLTQLRFADGKYQEAIDAARRAIAANDGSPQGHYLLGRVLAAQGQVDDASRSFKQAIQVSPTFVPAAVELARMAIGAGNSAEAIQYAEGVIQLSPDHGEALLLLARAHLLAGNPKGAERPMTRIAGTNVASVQAEYGLLLFQRGDLAGSRAALEKALASDKKNVTAIEGLVAIDVRQQRADAARKRLDSLLAANPSDAVLQTIGARLYATELRDMAAAEQAAKRAVAADANNLAGYELLARIYAQTGRLPEATAEFEKLSARQPKSVANLTAVALLHSLQGKPDDAKATYEKILAIDPKSPIAANNLAQMYADRNENLDTALELAKTAKAGLPKSHEVDDTLGWIYYKKGLAPLALDSLKAAATARPQNGAYLYHLGAAYALNKDAANARATLEKAIKLAPFAGVDDAKKILATLK